jgi:hypothetical protein
MPKLVKTSRFWEQTELKSDKFGFDFSSPFQLHFSVQIRRHQTLIASNGHFVSNLEDLNP